MAARSRLREALPDALASTQRSFSSEADDAERSSSAMIPLTQTHDPQRRDNRLRRDIDKMRSDIESGQSPKLESPSSSSPVRQPARGGSRVPAVVAAALALGTAAAINMGALLDHPWDDRIVVALCVIGALAIGRILAYKP